MNAITDTVRRMRFTRHDLANIVTAPRKAGKAYAVAALELARSALMDQGIFVPDDVFAGATSVGGWALGGALAFAVAWLFPNR